VRVKTLSRARRAKINNGCPQKNRRNQKLINGLTNRINEPKAYQHETKASG
jgi:hypothetical protein